MAVSCGARKPSHKDNLDDILDAPDRERLIEWLHFQPLAHFENGVTMVHAGIPPIWTVQDALERGWEVENALQGTRCKEFLTEMYGNDPYVWDDSLSGMTRLRVITNYLTRMRYCTRKGKLDLLSKGPQPIPDAMAGKKVAPWFSHKRRLTKGQTIIFGHWASLKGMTDDPNNHWPRYGLCLGEHANLLRARNRTALYHWLNASQPPVSAPPAVTVRCQTRITNSASNPHLPSRQSDRTVTLSESELASSLGCLI